MSAHRAVLLAWILLAPVPAPSGAETLGAVVFRVTPNEEADRAGLRAGDRLLAYSAGDDANPALPASGPIAEPLDLERVLREHGARVAVTLRLEREGELLELPVEPGTWGLTTRPDLDPEELDRLRAGRAGLDSGDEAEARAGLAIWRELAGGWRAEHPARALWLDLERAREAGRRKFLAEALDAAASSARGAEILGEPFAGALAAELRGVAHESASEFDAAHTAFLEVSERLAAFDPPGLLLAGAYQHLGRIAWWQDRLDDAEREHERALAIRERIAPEGLPVADSYNDLGLVAWNRGDVDACERFHRRALAIRLRLAPLGVKTAYSHVNLGIVAWKRGTLAEAEREYSAALALYERIRPDGPEMARLLSNIGIVRTDRGRLVEAEAILLRGLELMERWANRRDIAHLLTNLGRLEMNRGEIELARGYLRRALAVKEELGLRVDLIPTLLLLADVAADSEERESWLSRARTLIEEDSPDSQYLVPTLLGLARSARDRGLEERAATLLAGALEHARQVAPGSLAEADVLAEIGRTELARGDAEAGERSQRAALELTLSIVPGGIDEARGRHRLARALVARGATEAALAELAAAEAALESGLYDREGTWEERARYGSSWSELSFDHADLLLGLGRVADALRVAERYRGRELVRMLAERDLEFRELGPELARRREVALSRYRRLLSRQREAGRRPAATEMEELLAARRELGKIEAEAAQVAPRVARWRDPAALGRPLDELDLELGTVALLYLVGPRRSWLLALGPGGGELSALPVAAGAAELERRVAELRRELSTPGVRSSWRLRGAELAELLLAPVADRIRRAERVLVLPDGALHQLPFAALPLPGPGGGRLLVELRPLHSAASLGALRELRRPSEPEARPLRVVAFADPAYGARAAAPERARDLAPLPESRQEAEAIRRLFPGAAELWLGATATEERAKEVSPDVTHLHFACHALVDPRAPLDSALALAAPGAPVTGDDGLLQAWEIFEEMRLDADLVTLSACDTALGEPLPGEGVLGLVRAFHFAGARAVLATQWQIADRAAAPLVAAFYARLGAGDDAASALRAAQLELLGDRATAHPYYWAAFQLSGAVR